MRNMIDAAYRDKGNSMATLGNAKNTIQVLQKYDLHLQKKYGQNFLIDERILRGIVEAAEVDKSDFVLEIGPGIGTMTQYLCEAAGWVAAVEIDAHLIPVLEDTLSSYNNVEIINQDILKLDIAELLRRQGNDALRKVKVVANLPYYITTPIIMALLESRVPIDSITVMVQKEVADRMRTGPGSKDYGALSLAVQYYAQPEVVLSVPPSAFIPQPSVGSSVIRLTRHQAPPVQVQDERLMFRVIRAAFNQRRKTLVNALGNSGMFPLSKEQLAECIGQLGVPANIRGEVLTLEQFARLSDIIKSK